MDHLGIRARANRTPEKIAIVTPLERITFAELDARANRAAHVLVSVARTQPRVGIALRNRIEWYEIAAGAARLGLEVTPIPWRAAEREAAYYIEDSGSAPVVVEDDAWDHLDVMRVGELTARMRTAPDIPADGEPDPIRIRYYTSGTTGRPKAVERTPRTRGQSLEGLTRYLEVFDVIDPDGVHLVCGPLYHTAPLAFSTQALQTGHTIVVPDHFDAEETLRLIEAERVTWTFVVPIHLQRILALPDAVKHRYDLSSLHRVLLAGAPCPDHIKRAAIEFFPHGVLWEFYGTTEGRATVISPDESLRKPGSVGRAIPGLTLKVFDVMGHEVPCGEIGMIYFSPLDGQRFWYAGAPDKTDAAWRDGLFTVGDMGYVDDEGYVFLTDRKHDVMITGGANVYPAEVEAALVLHPAIADACVFGVPDDEWGERVHAVVQARAAVSAEELIAFCRDNLAHYKCPQVIEFTDELARDLNGKIRRRDLRDPHWAGRARRI